MSALARHQRHALGAGASRGAPAQAFVLSQRQRLPLAAELDHRRLAADADELDAFGRGFTRRDPARLSAVDDDQCLVAEHAVDIDVGGTGERGQ